LLRKDCNVTYIKIIERTSLFHHFKIIKKLCPFTITVIKISALLNALRAVDVTM
jgi:hypothetical protein